MNETDKLIEEQIRRQAIGAVSWKALVQEIGRANMLDAEQIASLEQETMFIIYAFDNPDDYVSNIARELDISADVAYTIAESIGDKIFDPISKQSEGYENMTVSASVPEIPPVNLPMIEEGKVAHDAPKIETESEPKVSLPDYRYEGGKDPYREPLG